MMKRLILTVAAALFAFCAGAQSVVDIASLVSEGKYREALMEANTLVVDGSADDAVYYYKGVCEMNTGELASAEESFLRAFEADTLNSWYCGALVTYYSAVNRPAQVCAFYSRAMELSPAEYRTTYHLCRYADALRSFHMPKEAEQAYRDALSADSGCLEALLGLCEVKLGVKDYASFFALSDYFVRREDVPAQMKGEYIENIFTFLNQDMFNWWHESIDSLVVHCVRSAPADSTCLSAAAQWFYGTGRTAQGTEYFEKLAAACPKSSGPRINLVSLRMSDSDYEGAIRECLGILDAGFADIDRSAVLGIVADCYERMDREKEAFAYYRKAIKENPDNASALNNYAYRLCTSGKKLAQAEKMAAHVLELDPDNPTYIDTYGWILYCRRKYEPAKKAFKRAMVYGGKQHREIVLHYAAVLEALGEKDLADYYRNLDVAR